MSQIKILIADPDEVYLDGIALEFLKRERERVDLLGITDSAYWEKFRSAPEDFDIALINEKLFDEEISGFGYRYIFILTDKMGDFDSFMAGEDNIKLIYKWSSASDIIDRVIDGCPFYEIPEERERARAEKARLEEERAREMERQREEAERAREEAERVREIERLVILLSHVRAQKAEHEIKLRRKEEKLAREIQLQREEKERRKKEQKSKEDRNRLEIENLRLEVKRLLDEKEKILLDEAEERERAEKLRNRLEEKVQAHSEAWRKACAETDTVRDEIERMRAETENLRSELERVQRESEERINTETERIRRELEEQARVETGGQREGEMLRREAEERKFAEMDRLLREREERAASAKTKKRSTEVILMHGSAGGAGKTAVALGMACCMSRMRRQVLYIDAEYMQNFQVYMASGKRLSREALSCLQANQQDIYKKMKRFIYREGFAYIPESPRYLQLYNVGMEAYFNLIRGAKESGDFDYIIVDTDSGFGNVKATLFSIADRAIVVSRAGAEGDARLENLHDILDSESNADQVLYARNFVEQPLNGFSAAEGIQGSSIDIEKSAEPRTIGDLGKIRGIRELALKIIALPEVSA